MKWRRRKVEEIEPSAPDKVHDSLDTLEEVLRRAQLVFDARDRRNGIPPPEGRS